MRHFHKASSILVITTIVLMVTACKQKPVTGFEFADGKLCHHSADGQSLCALLDDKHLVFVENEAQKIKVTERSLKGVVGKDKLGKASEADVLWDILQKNKVAVAFDAKTSTLSWRGDTVTVTAANSGIILAQLNPAGTMGLVIAAKADGSSASVSVVGAPKCTHSVDIDALMDETCRTNPAACDAVFFEQDGALVASFGGGISIQVIDPVIDDDLRALRALNVGLIVPGYDAWLRTRGGMGAVVDGSPFLKIEDISFATLSSPPIAPPKTETKVSEAATDRAHKLVSEEFVMLCGMQNVEIECCGRFFTFRKRPDGEVLFNLDASLCEIKIIPRPDAHSPEILCRRACRTAFPKDPCKPIR